jgi:hypothetical protein
MIMPLNRKGRTAHQVADADDPTHQQRKNLLKRDQPIVQAR